MGHKLDKQGIAPIRNNIVKINDFPVPNSRKKLQSYLGLVNYYRSYVKDIAKLASPMYELLKGDKKFEWNSEANKAFDEIKQRLIGGVKLFHPQDNKPFIIT